MQAQQIELEQLIESHRRRLFGFLRGRVRSDADAADLAQDTWVEVLGHGATYDPAKGTFWAFTLIWAKIVLARHWEKVQRESVGDLIPGDESEDGSGVEDTPDDGTSPEDRMMLSGAFLELLRRVAACSRPPHEILAFGFTRLEWRPQEIVAELSPQSLTGLQARLERDYAAFVPAPALHAAFLPLRMKLPLRVGDVMPDPRTRDIYTDLLARVTGETRLADYFRSFHSPEALLVRWWDSVKRSVFVDIRRTGRGLLFERLQGGGCG